MFQEMSSFKNFELQDISIYLKITTYYNRVQGNTINIPVAKSNQVIMSLLGSLKVKAYIIEICNIELAKKQDVTLNDILVDFNFQHIQFRKSITVHLENKIMINCSSGSKYITSLIESLILKIFIIKICDRDVAIQSDPSIGDIILDRDIQDIQFQTELKVECGGYEFQDHEINLYLNLNKLKVCLLENDENTIKIFNQKNFALVGFIDYCNIGYVETSWKPDFETASSIENLFLLVQKCYNEFYNYFLIKILNILQNNPPNDDDEFQKIHDQILSTFELELLRNGGELDLKIQISSLTDIQKQQLQELQAEQIHHMIRFNAIKDEIENKTFENIERLQYLVEYNIFVEQIQNETDLHRLRGVWITKIDNSRFSNEEKLNLHKICKERIRILLEQSQQSDYQRIRNSILEETNITNLEDDKYWFKEINRSSLNKNQRKELNDLHAKTLIALFNKQYDKIRKEILETNDSFLLEDRGDINKQIRLLKDNNLTDER
ncbi:25231_t:CDS:2 [Dentiscutata erythropus]|uniref:25231_t:CDS:1 n=1 Tax=Dentiscutata erythropus TaxID=1348616 RepID=A0A9N9GW50_9GLOM|nr:25231_t:CDS:2 [Dentiscutata erythropus]